MSNFYWMEAYRRQYENLGELDPIHFTCRVVEAELTLRGPLSSSICSFRLSA